MNSKSIMVVAALLAFLAMPTMAEPITDTFWGDWVWEEGFWDGGGSGYDDGHWYWYETGGLDDVFVQWYYDHPYDPDRWKTIHVEYDAVVQNPAEGEGGHSVFVNWTTPEWSALGLDHPPRPDDVPTGQLTDLYIETSPRQYNTAPVLTHFEYDFVIPDYNPEWISIDFDVPGRNLLVSNGVIIHECVPEPGALALLALGGLAAFRRR